MSTEIWVVAIAMLILLVMSARLISIVIKLRRGEYDSTARQRANRNPTESDGTGTRTDYLEGD
ncbi:hypothetical protein [Ruegeria atlantica]|uniref:hypothetical protein n=1 Tax=Ruegeria atlantica TaxID=81569 RepID=UPI00148001AD|nr:hypothetical protein [Ruegeria atlantica]